MAERERSRNDKIVINFKIPAKITYLLNFDAVFRDYPGENEFIIFSFM